MNRFWSLFVLIIGASILEAQEIQGILKANDSADVDPLARSYYAAGDRYEKVGKSLKGQSFKKAAQKRDARANTQNLETIDDDQVFLSSRKKAEKDILSLENKTDTQESNQQLFQPDQKFSPELAESIVRFQFNRFARGLVSKNPIVFQSLIASKIQVGSESFLSSEFMSILDKTLKEKNLQNFSLDELYENQGQVSYDESQNLYCLKIKANPIKDLESLPFWKSNQEYYFSRQQDGQWFLTKITSF